MTVANMSVAIKVRRLRLERGMTQQSLAFATGLSMTGIQKVEQGRHEPLLPTLRVLAKALGVSMAELLDEAARRLPAEMAA